MTSVLGLHLTDAVNRPSIEVEGVLLSESPKSWLGAAAYFSFVERLQDFGRCVSYCQQFVRGRPGYSGNSIAVICDIDAAGLIDTQEDTVRSAIKDYVRLFNEKCQSAGIILPENNFYDRPASFIRLEVWRRLVDEQLAAVGSGESAYRICGAVCRFSRESLLDVPGESPREIAVYDSSAMRVRFIGTPEEARAWLRPEWQNRATNEWVARRAQREVAGATHSVMAMLANMEPRDFVRIVEAISKPRRPSDARKAQTRQNSRLLEFQKQTLPKEVERLRELVEAKHRNDKILDVDLGMVYEDYDRQGKVQKQLELDLDLSLGRRWARQPVAEFSAHPERAAIAVVKAFGQTPGIDPLGSILSRLPVEVRQLRGLKGKAYYFPRGGLARKAVFVTREGPAYSRGKAQEIAFNRAHELGHYIFDELDLVHPDEERWCDEFARSFLVEIDHWKRLAARR